MEVHHLGWAVRSLRSHRDHFEGQLGLPYEGQEDFPSLRVAFYRAGSCLIELLEPLTEEDDVSVYLRDRGEGIHHIAYRVDDVAAALEEAGRRGMRVLDREPRPGARGTRIGFVDPGRADGILVEYVEVPR